MNKRILSILLAVIMVFTMIPLTAFATEAEYVYISVSYDDKSNKYYYTPGMSRCIDHVNEAPVFATVELKARDCIEVGESKFIFIPLCGSNFKWEEWQEDEEE